MIEAECRRLAPDITAEEISELIEEEATVISKSRKVDNPTGLLIRKMPFRCEPESLKLWRTSALQRRISKAYEVIQSPRYSEPEKQPYRDFLNSLLEQEP